MNHNWPFVVSLLLAWILTDILIPHVVRLARKIGKMDNPDPRKVHKEPIPRLGGIAIFLGFLLSLVGIELLEPGFFLKNTQWYGIIIGAFLMFLVGVVDDIINLSAKTKFFSQIIISIIAFYFGVKIVALSNPFGAMLVLPDYLSIIVTVFWIVGITNTINLIDGLDGLAAGVSMIAGITLFIIAIQTNQDLIAVIILSLVGATIGFLRYNFNPAKIFMGDSGSLFLGFTLASISVAGVLKLAATVTILLPILILGIPIMDTSFAILRRFFNRKPIFQPDKGHLHHRLLNMGLSQKRAVIVIYSFSSLLAGIALYLIGIEISFSIITVSIMMLIIGFSKKLREMIKRD
jgi:UDP-GlcNAc:undecaprenyl-phosphate GlcNAc-1-phosphate transferase